MAGIAGALILLVTVAVSTASAVDDLADLATAHDAACQPTGWAYFDTAYAHGRTVSASWWPPQVKCEITVQAEDRVNPATQQVEPSPSVTSTKSGSRAAAYFGPPVALVAAALCWLVLRWGVSAFSPWFRRQDP
ncbi:MAG: hypothetical protein ACJ735_16745 [Actinomycetes bacterium]